MLRYPMESQNGVLCRWTMEEEDTQAFVYHMGHCNYQLAMSGRTSMPARMETLVY